MSWSRGLLRPSPCYPTPGNDLRERPVHPTAAVDETSLRLVARRQTEQREQPLGVEEERELADAAARTDQTYRLQKPTRAAD